MRLNLHTDYALRMLMLLAARGEQLSIDEIAAHYGISRNHLVKVTGGLAQMGLVNAKRGRGGGLTLAHAPRDINVGKVVRTMESLDGFVECFDASENTCPVAGACGLQGALSAALSDFLKRLDSYSLADILPDKNRFMAQLEAVSA